MFKLFPQISKLFPKTVKSCEVMTKADTGSHYRMVRGRLKLNKKLMRLKKIQKQKPPMLGV